MKPLYAAGLATVLVATGCTAAERRAVPTVRATNGDQARYEAVSLPGDVVRVMTLNMAHGRSDGFHQLFQSTERQRGNLDSIVAVIEREQPALVALQEADGPSAWSGDFCHVTYLAAQSGLDHFVRGSHVAGMGLEHGTALMSDLPLADPLTVTFAPSVAGTPKGFVVSTVRWPGSPGLEVDVVSVHLEPFRTRVRERQIYELIDSIGTRDRPLILMGDFNSRWAGKRRLMQRLADAMTLQTVPGDHPDMATLPVLGRRVDWILVSPEFEIRDYDTLPDVISDHRAVVAEIALRPDRLQPRSPPLPL